MAPKKQPVCRRCKIVHPVNTGVAFGCKKNKASSERTQKAKNYYFEQSGVRVGHYRNVKTYTSWAGEPIYSGFRNLS